MARPLRARVAGGWYHVMARVRDRGRLFRSVGRPALRRVTLRELGARVGNVDYTAVAMAIRRLEARSQRSRSLRQVMQSIANEDET